MGRAPRTKETLPDFLKWRRVTRPPLVFRGLTGSQPTPGFWGVTLTVGITIILKEYKYKFNQNFCKNLALIPILSRTLKQPKQFYFEQ